MGAGLDRVQVVFGVRHVKQPLGASKAVAPVLDVLHCELRVGVVFIHLRQPALFHAHGDGGVEVHLKRQCPSSFLHIYEVTIQMTFENLCLFHAH